MRIMNLTALLLATTARLAFFDWKKEADGKLTVDADGNPIWIGTDNKELIVKGETVTSLRGEAMQNRQRAEAAEGKLKAFEDAGVTDAAAAAEALTVAGKVKQGELIAAGKVDEVRGEITKSFEKKITDAEKLANEATSRADRILLNSAFVGSGFIKDKLIIPNDIAMAQFGSRFKIEGDKVVAMKADGSGPIYSEKNAGEVATFDEAMEIIVNGYAHKSAILKGANQTGSGNGGGGGNGPGGIKTMDRDAFGKLSPADQGKLMAEVRAGTAKLTE